MTRRKVRRGAKETLASYIILAFLGLIAVWLLVRQAHFNPAVQVALRGGQPPGRTAAAGSSPAATAAFFPDVPGFSPRGPIEKFGPETLSDKINGRAELYLAAGFKELSCRSFTVDGAEGAFLEVFVYDMGSAANAYAVFSAQRRPGSAEVPLGPPAYSTPNALFFTQGRFYVELVGDRSSEALLTQLPVYARALLAKLPSEGEAPATAALFPPEGLKADSVRLSAADTFGLEGFNQVYTADYTVTGDTVTAFLAERQTPAQAEAEARRYQDFLLANGYRRLEKPGLPPSVRLFQLDTSFEIVLVEGRTLAGVHDAPALEAALELAEKLRGRIKGKP